MSTRDGNGLLATRHYDDDATLVVSDTDSDAASTADNFESSWRERDSVQDDDREVLEEAEEQEKLLSKPTPFDAVKNAFKNTRREERRQKRAGRRHKGGKQTPEESKLMFEMEEGFKDTISQSSFETAERIDTGWRKPASSSRKRGMLVTIYILIALLFAGLLYGAFKASRNKNSGSLQNNFWNGTHTFKPTTILISLDGFRADFLNRGLTPAMNAFIASGVSPRYMLPSFPSVTFPNHFTLVTGLYPESHGIVSNQFWDPALQEEFYYTHLGVSMQPKWWNAEPLWVTAENQGVRTAIHMWPGSEAHIAHVEPTYVDKFNGSEVLTRKVDRLLHWLDMPGDGEGESDKRPQLLLAYVPNVDTDGHKYGPNSTEIRGTIADVDSMLTILVEGLLERNLTEIVNLVIVSDHGMATTSNDRLIQLDDLIDMSLIDHIDGWPLRGLRLKDPERDVPILHEQLLKEAQKSGSFDVYTLETMPERYHFSNNDRIAPLWIVPKTGWAVVEKHDFNVEEAKLSGKVFEPLGLHGYDHEHPLMRAIFVARGPAFPHPPNSRVSVFQNIEVYNIVCDSIGIKPHPNNGTLHLPLKTEGLHSDFDAPHLETPDDVPDDAITSTSSKPSQSATQSATSTKPEPTKIAEPESTEIAEPESGTPSEKKPGSKTSWWDFVHDQLQKAKEWAKEFVESIKNNKPESKNATNAA